MLNNTMFNYTSATNGLLTNPFMTSPSTTIKNTLSLNQIEGFTPVQEFSDETNTKWSLVKSSLDSTIDIPDPKTLQIVDFWNHEFPNLKTKLYVYVVEGVRQPRVETEQPSRILYQWFSPVFVPTFTPQMISDKEWLKANVYAAPVVNARISKLNAICHIKGSDVSYGNVDVSNDKLLKVDELNGTSRPVEGN